MHIFRGHAATPTQDREWSRELLDLTADRDSPHLRVWQPPRHLAFGRRDSSQPGYARAREYAHSREIPTIERTTGGHAVFFTGTTVSFILATPVDDPRTGLDDRYERTITRLRRALSDLGVDAYEGEPDGAFCPGTHSLSATGKIVGLAQRVRSDVAVVAGIVIVNDHEEIAAVLEPVYEALDIPFEPASTGSIARAGGVRTSEDVVTTIESALSEGEPTITHR
jgi:lipoate-protein ligase A